MLTSGTKLGPYEIQSPLGAGGMGEVYRATDTKLGRDVALKVLPAEMAHDGERLGRFRREAKTLAQLDHPNIVTIYSVEESDGVHFLTMQLVDGQPLDRLIPQDGLPIERIIEIGGALADALAAAHEKNIVHRDLKPANVMVSREGRIKVLDFGLAKDVRAAHLTDATLTSDSRTQVGVVMGTPAYMSPEQTSGRPLDHRTDIFSLGVVLHEMATGRRPFEGTSSAELISAILRDSPPSVTDLRSDLPADLARIIRRCLEKDPRYRMQTARDVSNEFRDLVRATTRPGPVSTSPGRAADSGGTRADEGFWVAVLPFKYIGGNADLSALAEGLTDDIITGMSRFSYLRVIARSSTARYAQQAVDVRTAAKELGARYVMDGSIRQAGTKIRIAVQLVDASTGASLWAETYDRPFTPETTLELLDDVVPRIVATIADTQGVLPHSMTDALRNRDPESLTPYEALLRSFGYHQRVNAAEHLAARTALERAVKQPPDRGDCWAMLSWLYRAEYTHGFNPLPDPLGRALVAGRRAVDLAPTNHLSHTALASALFFRREYGAARAAAERALAFNRMEGYATAFLGMQFAFSGDWERGCVLATRSTQLNPNHPGWYWFPEVFNAYRQRDGVRALEFALKVNMPGFWLAQLGLAVVYSQLEEMEHARIAVRNLLTIRPDFAATAQEELSKWWLPEMVEQMLADLRKAGLDITHDVPTPATSSGVTPVRTVSGETRAEEGFWIAVLPFKYTGGNADLKALSEGLSEEVVTGLSRFSYLRVIARGSTAKYSSESGDVRAIGKELGARYVMDGNIRQAGSAIRLAVQLVDATNGAHLWAETFERSFRPEEIFALQDELVPRIVSTAADQHGILPRSIGAAIRKKSDEQLSPYEAVFRVFSLHETMTAQGHAACRDLLERAVRDAPDAADCWAMLATLYSDEDWFGFNLRPDPLGRAAAAAQRAAELAPASALATQALAQSLFMRHEWQAFRPVAERTIALNRMDGATVALMGILLACTGDWERGCAVADSAMKLHPSFPGWYWLARLFNAYQTRDYRAAIDAALRIQMPGYFWTPVVLTAAYGQLGEKEAARKSLRELLAVRPNFAATARQELEKWFEPALVEHFLEGLNKAGLEVETSSAAKATSPTTGPGGTTSGAARADEGFWIAVLPFKYTGSNADLKALAEGISEEVITGLSRFSYLRVIARGSTVKYSSEWGDVRAIGKELGARYVMEGTLRQAANKLRLAVQLLEATTGSHLWAETYERASQSDSVFELQDELVPRIVSTVADRHGVLPHSMSEAVRAKDLEQLTPYEAVLLSFSYAERIASDEQIAAKACLERAVAQVPGYADAWAMLAMLFCDEYGLGFTLEFPLLERALEAARRAVKAGPSNHLAYQNLAYAHFLRREFGPCRSAVERSLTLNSLDGSNVWFMGLVLAYMGDWERGCALVERAMQLNPNFPGKYRYPLVANAYRKGDYKGALNEALRMNLPDVFYTPLNIAAAAGQLGERQTAENALRDLLALKPDIAATARESLGKWFQPELVQHVIEGLAKAGLDVADTGAPPASKPAVTASGESRADEGFWVAVLPFKYIGSSQDLKALAEGLSEEVVTGLSRFSYLRVIARGSTAKYSSESGDVRAIGKELGARYVMEGSLRQAGSKLRLAVQLVDTISGAHLWAETYERAFDPETIFELQDDLVPRIVSTVADHDGILPLSMAEALRSKSDDQLTPHEAMARSFGFFKRLTPEEHAKVRQILETAVRKSPDHGDCWAMLSHLYSNEYWGGFNPAPDPLARALDAARRAVDMAPSNHLSYWALALALYLRRDLAEFRTAAERAVELNRMDGSSVAFMGALIAYSGEWETGCAMAEPASALNPNHAGWHKVLPFYNAFRKGEDRQALAAALRLNAPGSPSFVAARAAAYGELGEHEAAQKAVKELLALDPAFATTGREFYDKFLPAQLVDRLIGGLRKAGLEIRSEKADSIPIESPASAAAGKTPSGEKRADEGFWIAVLPFKYTGSNADLKALAEGISEEVITGLSRFSYLRVIARGSTAKYSSEWGDVRAIGKELGARYVMEGTLRQAGNKLRLAVQLLEATTGSHLWAETYERGFNPEAVFELQDDLVPRIVSTVADINGVLSRSMSEAVRSRTPEQLTPYEAVLRSFGYFERVTPEEMNAAIAGIESALQKAPSYADAWAMLALLSVQRYAQGFGPAADSLVTGASAARKAVETSPANHLAWFSLSQVLFFQKEFRTFRNAAERALGLNPMDSNSLALNGEMLALSGQWERGISLAARARQLNPHHPGWYWHSDFNHAYRQRDYRAALEIASKMNQTSNWGAWALTLAACGQLGDREGAAKAVRELLRLRPDAISRLREDCDKWFDAEHAAHILEGFRKAGLNI